jgi:hypothetical protein
VGVGVGRPEVRVSGFWVVEVVEAGGGDGGGDDGGGVRVRVRVPGGSSVHQKRKGVRGSPEDRRRRGQPGTVGWPVTGCGGVRRRSG